VTALRVRHGRWRTFGRAAKSATARRGADPTRIRSSDLHLNGFISYISFVAAPELKEKQMNIFACKTTKKQLQQVLDQEQTQHVAAMTVECNGNQQPQNERPMFRQPNKSFQVDVMGGWEKP
jgi:hypothetical protein